jgi:mRNA interferase MazF
MNAVQGDIVLIPFPFSNLKNAVKRPALVISNQQVNNTEDIIVAQITSTIRNDKFSFLLENEYLTQRLPAKSEIRIHKIFTVDKTEIIKCLSNVKHEKLFEILEKIKTLF